MCGFLQYMIVFSSLYKFCEQTMRCETRCLHFFCVYAKTNTLIFFVFFEFVWNICVSVFNIGWF